MEAFPSLVDLTIVILVQILTITGHMINITLIVALIW